ncbi:MAG: sortase B protein-sorting domain-containing protein [Desulfobacterales bacterium]
MAQIFLYVGILVGSGVVVNATRCSSQDVGE